MFVSSLHGVYTREFVFAAVTSDLMKHRELGELGGLVLLMEQTAQVEDVKIYSPSKSIMS